MAKEQAKPVSNKLVTRDYIAHLIGRPTPWVHARLEEEKIEPALSLDDVEYFPADAVDLMRLASEEVAARVRQAKREASMIGD